VTQAELGCLSKLRGRGFLHSATITGLLSSRKLSFFFRLVSRRLLQAAGGLERFETRCRVMSIMCLLQLGEEGGKSTRMPSTTCTKAATQASVNQAPPPHGQQLPNLGSLQYSSSTLSLSFDDKFRCSSSSSSLFPTTSSCYEQQRAASGTSAGSDIRGINEALAFQALSMQSPAAAAAAAGAHEGMMPWGSCRRAAASQVDHHSCLFSSCCGEEEDEEEAAEEELEMDLLHGGGGCSSMENDMMIKQQQDLDSTCINAAEESENSLPGAGGGSVAGCNSKDHLHAVDGGGVHESKLCPRGHWRPAEDEKLRELVSQYGPQNWNLIAEKLQGRSGTRLLLHHDVLYQDFPAAGRHHCGCK
jgi:hypothetical protein